MILLRCISYIVSSNDVFRLKLWAIFRLIIFFSVALRPNTGHGLLILEVFLDHTQRRSTVGRTPLDEWSARRRDLYLTTHNTHNRQTTMPPVGLETAISACERPQTYALDRAATGTSWLPILVRQYVLLAMLLLLLITRSRITYKYFNIDSTYVEY